MVEHAARGEAPRLLESNARSPGRPCIAAPLPHWMHGAEQEAEGDDNEHGTPMRLQGRARYMPAPLYTYIGTETCTGGAMNKIGQALTTNTHPRARIHDHHRRRRYRHHHQRRRERERKSRFIQQAHCVTPLSSPPRRPPPSHRARTLTPHVVVITTTTTATPDAPSTTPPNAYSCQRRAPASPPSPTRARRPPPRTTAWHASTPYTADCA